MTSALEALIIDPGEGCPGIEDVKVVGSFKKGTMLNGSVTADVVAQLRSLPTHEVVAKLSRYVQKLISSGQYCSYRGTRENKKK